MDLEKKTTEIQVPGVKNPVLLNPPDNYRTFSSIWGGDRPGTRHLPCRHPLTLAISIHAFCFDTLSAQ